MEEFDKQTEKEKRILDWLDGIMIAGVIVIICLVVDYLNPDANVTGDVLTDLGFICIFLLFCFIIYKSAKYLYYKLFNKKS
jgi:uncharacterized membrane protein YobD (UPF0266 family)